MPPIAGVPVLFTRRNPWPPAVSPSPVPRTHLKTRLDFPEQGQGLSGVRQRALFHVCLGAGNSCSLKDGGPIFRPLFCSEISFMNLTNSCFELAPQVF